MTSIEESIAEIKNKWNYDDIETAKDLFGISQQQWSAQFFAGYGIDDPALKHLKSKPIPEEWALVTGFGPTNAPTMGTISLISKALYLQKELGIRSDIIISDIGAWNSRNKKFEDIIYHTDKLIEFIRALGFDETSGNLKTHRDPDNMKNSLILAKAFDLKDFNENKEETEELYEALGLLGKKFGIYVDMLLTVGDIMTPMMEKIPNVIVISGIEEHYFSKLTSIARKNLSEIDSNFEFINKGKQLGFFANVIPGLNSYPKMSKSIPDSAITITESMSDITDKIEKKENWPIVVSMLENCMAWDSDELLKMRKQIIHEDNRSYYIEQLKQRIFMMKEIWEKI